MEGAVKHTGPTLAVTLTLTLTLTWTLAGATSKLASKAPPSPTRKLKMWPGGGGGPPFMVTRIIAIRFSRFEFWIPLIAATSISVEAPPSPGVHRTSAPPLERRRSSSRPSGAPASFPRSAASLNSNSSAVACGDGGWSGDTAAGGAAAVWLQVGLGVR